MSDYFKGKWREGDFIFYQEKADSLGCTTVKAIHVPTGKKAETWGNNSEREKTAYLKRVIQRDIDMDKLDPIPRDRISVRVELFDDDMKLRQSSQIGWGEQIVLDNVVVNVGLTLP
jgi:hypothetical protein